MQQAKQATKLCETTENYYAKWRRTIVKKTRALNFKKVMILFLSLSDINANCYFTHTLLILPLFFTTFFSIIYRRRIFCFSLLIKINWYTKNALWVMMRLHYYFLKRTKVKKYSFNISLIIWNVIFKIFCPILELYVHIYVELQGEFIQIVSYYNTIFSNLGFKKWIVLK